MKRTVSLNSTSRAPRRRLISWGTSNSSRCTSIYTTIHSYLTNRAHLFSRQSTTTRRQAFRASRTTAETWTQGARAHMTQQIREKGKKEATMRIQSSMNIKIKTSNNLNLKWFTKNAQGSTRATLCTGGRYRVRIPATTTRLPNHKGSQWL